MKIYVRKEYLSISKTFLNKEAIEGNNCISVENANITENSDNNNNSQNSKKQLIIILSIIGSILGVAIIIVGVILIRKRIKKKHLEELSDSFLMYSIQ